MFTIQSGLGFGCLSNPAGRPVPDDPAGNPLGQPAGFRPAL